LVQINSGVNTMQVSDILRVKGGTLYTIAPDALLRDAIETMSRLDIGSLAVMNRGELAGMLTFREVIHTLANNGGSVGSEQVSGVMDTHPTTCTPATDITEVRPLMLERHTRYMPVMDGNMLMGVISFYDVAKAVVDSQNFENQMLKAYIRDWPEEQGKA
jgi:CBS domain-containing protein